jgi:hypothetical protein
VGIRGIESNVKAQGICHVGQSCDQTRKTLIIRGILNKPMSVDSYQSSKALFCTSGFRGIKGIIPTGIGWSPIPLPTLFVTYNSGAIEREDKTRGQCRVLLYRRSLVVSWGWEGFNPINPGLQNGLFEIWRVLGLDWYWLGRSTPIPPYKTSPKEFVLFC